MGRPIARGQYLDQFALAGDPQTDEAIFALLLQLLRDVFALAALVIAGSGICRQEGIARSEATQEAPLRGRKLDCILELPMHSHSGE
jgi:hypothetical protein